MPSSTANGTHTNGTHDRYARLRLAGVDREPVIQDDSPLDESLIALAIAEHDNHTRPRLERFWRYFRNALEPAPIPVGHAHAVERPRGGYRLAQEAGLPTRLTGGRPDVNLDDRAFRRREVVIENDIAWRVQTMVDFMFGRPVQVLSTATDGATREAVERTLDAVWEASGGITLLQDFALLGHVYGHVDLVVRVDEDALAAGAAPEDAIRIELIEPTRGVPIVSPDDYRRLDAYVIHYERALNSVEHDDRAAGNANRKRSAHTEVITPGREVVYEDGEVVSDRRSALFGEALPVVHVQNLSQPYRYSGLGEVEPLMPLQDELNTRLSDRASRVTMQSFRMLLAKGVDGFDSVPVGPGQVFSTDNPDVAIVPVGGDADAPSERAHVDEIREALDKISGVPPLAGGVIRAKIGNLSSANALRITLMSLLAKTARKWISYGRGIEQASRLVLAALDAAGVLPTSPMQRGIRLVWPDPLPQEADEAARTAQSKLELGVSRERVLSELGYAPTDPGIV